MFGLLWLTSQATRFKHQEDEFRDLKARFSDVQRQVESTRSELDSLRKRADDAESALSRANADLEKQDSVWAANRPHISGKDRHTWLQDMPATSSLEQSRPDSPLLSTSGRTLSSDILMLQGLATKSRKISTPSSLVDGSGEVQSPSQRLSCQPPFRPHVLALHSGTSPTAMPSQFELHLASNPAPSPLVGDRDDIFDGLETVSSPQQVMQDVMSISTVAAGPSVQLVERMSAAIRRLEGEKVAAREEFTRISSQRDEARAEIVALMKEVEDARAMSHKVASLENEVDQINSRYQTTLEMLGEKSELVEELKADVEDVKAMYRELVERTIR
jgi:TATA element modulatory factor